MLQQQYETLKEFQSYAGDMLQEIRETPAEELADKTELLEELND